MPLEVVVYVWTVWIYLDEQIFVVHQPYFERKFYSLPHAHMLIKPTSSCGGGNTPSAVFSDFLVYENMPDIFLLFSGVQGELPLF